MASQMFKEEQKDQFGLDRFGRKGIVKEYLVMLAHLLILLVASGRPGWANAWIYIIFFFIFKTIGVVLLVMKDPELVNERGRFMKKDTKSFDRKFFILWIPLSLVLLIVAGIDAGRFGWTRLPVEISLLGLIGIILGFIISTWAMLVNTYFEATIRIQMDRDHEVCTSGPYQIVRHPGYAAAILSTLALPLLLGSALAFIPALLIAWLFVSRTVSEDQTLQKELRGYRSYVYRTPYRLVPYIW